MTAVADAVRRVLEAPVDAGRTAARAAAVSIPGVVPPPAGGHRGAAHAPRPLRQRGRSAPVTDFNAKHKRVAKGRVGGGQFATKPEQQKLASQGLYKGKPDGIHGPQTTAAVKAFQAKYGLEQTGRMDERTRATLENPPPKTAADVRRDEAAAKAATQPKGTSRGGASTRAAGTATGTRSASSGSGSTLNTSDPAAVKAFQQQHGLKADGIVGPNTRAMMQGTSTSSSTAAPSSRSSTGSRAGASTATSRRNAGPVNPNAERQGALAGGAPLRQGIGTDGKLKRGDRRVRILQEFLTSHGYDLGNAGVDGKFGPATTKAVKAMQRDLGLKADGVVGNRTRRVFDLMRRADHKRKPGGLTVDAQKLSEAATAAGAVTAQLLLEAAVRGAARGRTILRLPDGKFAPKGLGRELSPGQTLAEHPSALRKPAGNVQRPRAPRPRASAPKAPAAPKAPKPAAPKAAVPAGDLQATLKHIDALGLNDWPPKTDKTAKVLGAAVDTQQLHQVNGVYTAERKAVHDKIVAHFIGSAKAPSSGRPQALFMAGGAASGKSTALNKSPEFKPADAVEINPDAIKELLPEYQQLLKARDRYAATAAHEESSDIAARLMQEAQDRGLNVIVDGTGDSKRGKFAKKLQRMHDAGYDTRALYVTVPTEVAIGRAVSRAERTGRFVPVPELRTQHRNVSAWFEDIAKLPFLKGLTLYDTSTPEPTTLATAVGGKLTIKDGTGYKAFREKGKQT